MNLIALCTGAFLIGWMVPELIFVISPRNDIRGVAVGMNLFCAAGLALITYGLRA